ncbi:MAG: hypothetical protein ACJ8LG_21615 [Massilia sp.]
MSDQLQPEGLDGLTDLVAQADQVGSVSSTGNAPVAGGAPAEPPAEPSPEEQAADAVNMFADLVVGYAPAAADVWTPQARTASAAVMGPIFVKYGWSLTRLPPELAAAMVVGPLLYRSATVVAEKIKADRAEKATAQRQVVQGGSAGAPTGSGTPAPGPSEAPPVAVHPQVALFTKGATP